MFKVSLLLVFLLVTVCSRSVAQCGYTVSLETDTGYCYGAVLNITSAHRMAKIVWYRDGLPVDSSLASQSINSEATELIGFSSGELLAGALATDEERRLYFINLDDIYQKFRISMWTNHLARGISSADTTGNIGYFSNSEPGTVARLFVDSARNIYATSASLQEIIKYNDGPPGSVEDTGTAVAYSAGDGYGLFVDCDGTIYIHNVEGNVVKWLPGASSGTVLTPASTRGYAPIFVDSLSAVFTYVDQGINKWTPGTPPSNPGTPVMPVVNGWTRDNTDWWMTGSDSMYFVGQGPTASTLQLSCWVPGRNQLTVIGSTPVSFIGHPAITMDIEGNIYVAPGNGSGPIVEFARHSAIGTKYTPTEVGNYYAVVTDMRGYAAMSNSIQVNTQPPTVSVSEAPTDSVCQGDTAIFVATVTGGSSFHTFKWLVNGQSIAGDGTNIFTSNNLKNGNLVSCLLTGSEACALAGSNEVSVAVKNSPDVPGGQVFNISHGQSVTLDPVIQGDVVGWAWSPLIGLADSMIADPVAHPDSSVLYALTVTAPNGCKATGKILVDVYSPLSIPGAFTPNGDGHNDRFYVLGGPVNSNITDFSVFDRWGEKVFSAHNGVPGDPAFGWDGNIKGVLAPTGAYVYMVSITMPGGTRHLYKGTVVLIR